MANRSCGRRPLQIPVVPLAEQRPVVVEPVMRRWPHPVPNPTPTAQADPMLHYIRCALSYQNEVLGEIKTLLEELLAAGEGNGTRL